MAAAILKEPINIAGLDFTLMHAIKIGKWFGQRGVDYAGQRMENHRNIVAARQDEMLLEADKHLLEKTIEVLKSDKSTLASMIRNFGQAQYHASHDHVQLALAMIKVREK